MGERIGATPELVAQVQGDLARYSERLLHLFSFVPDEKLTWTPSPTAKSALRIVGHCALTMDFFANVITGEDSESMPAPEQFFQRLAEAEENVTTRDEAVRLLKESATRLSEVVGTVTSENIETTRRSPFGEIPLAFWIHQGREQLAGHAGQLEYLQTIWGDLDNHFG
ncbi:DinB family protein [bacterium]|nr:MAG: DinB family protein [bacterium]